MIAALHVESRGVYAGLPDVDLWDRDRDARTYAGPWPVVAHPPCARWGRSWGGHPTQQPLLVLGDDEGCFAAAALDAMRRHGGVLEHPEASPAWTGTSDSSRHREPEGGRDGLAGGVDVLRGIRTLRAPLPQDHMVVRRGRRVAWLRRGKSAAASKIEDGYHSTAERWRAIKMEACQRLSHRERHATPEPFRSPDRNGRHSQDEE